MNDIDLSQRAEEIELALAGLFESPKSPAISSYDEGTAFFVQVSWVVQSRGDTTLDKRCVVTIRFTPQQFQGYAHMNTAGRIVVRKRLCEKVRAQVSVQQEQPSANGDCSAEMTVDDALFDVADSY